MIFVWKVTMKPISATGALALTTVLSSASTPIWAQAPSPAKITIDATQRRAISPYVYGVNFPEWDKLGFRVPLARQGGNRLSAYNWETNASNAGSDWHHQNDAFMAPTDEPGYVGRTFVEDARKHGAAMILTVPMTGHVAADKGPGGDVNQTPNYLETRFNRSLPHKPGPFVYPPDTKDHVVYQDEYVAWIEKIKGPGTTVWYALDNEPDIWSGTHARIVPKTPTYAEFIQRSIEYAAAIKAVAPRAKIAGPVSYGWQGFRRFQNASDANNRDFLDVYLSAMQAEGQRRGKRLLDLLDIHFYPEARGDGVRVTEESPKPGTAAARIQAPRSLWDPTYVEDSWITQSMGGKPIALLPGIQKQIATHYPGTKLAVTEYNYGGRKDISGAIAQADVLGIYGRNGVYAACIWGMSPADSGPVAGFRAFLNYDGRGSQFGDLGLAVRGESSADDSVYAALDSRRPGRLTAVLINKTAQSRPMQLTIKGFAARRAAGYAVTQSSLTAPQPLAAAVGGGHVSVTAPPLSVVTLEVSR